MARQLSIFITDDHPIFRTGIKNILNTIHEVVSISEAENGAELLAKLKYQKADLVFLDIEMPVMNGMQTADVLKKEYPGTKIVVLSFSANSGHVDMMLAKDVEGYLLKSTSLLELRRCIDAVMNNDKYFCKEVLAKIASSKDQPPITSLEEAELTDKEVEVLKLMCKQYTADEICKYLNVTDSTVRRHKMNLMLKTGSNNIIGLVMFAIGNGLFSIYE